MSESHPYVRDRDTDRRRPRISHEELRRQLLDADQERYRLENELRVPISARGRGWSVWTQPGRRVAVGLGTVIVVGLAGGLAWQMCPSSARADERSSVRVETITVTPRLIVNEPSAAPPATIKAVKKVTVNAASRARQTPRVRNHVERQARSTRPIPRPLSPGEFGRPRLVAY